MIKHFNNNKTYLMLVKLYIKNGKQNVCNQCSMLNIVDENLPIINLILEDNYHLLQHNHYSDIYNFLLKPSNGLLNNSFDHNLTMNIETLHYFD